MIIIVFSGSIFIIFIILLPFLCYTMQWCPLWKSYPRQRNKNKENARTLVYCEIMQDVALKLLILRIILVAYDMTLKQSYFIQNKDDVSKRTCLVPLYTAKINELKKGRYIFLVTNKCD